MVDLVTADGRLRRDVLRVLAGEGMEPTAMAWTATGSAT